MAKTHLTIRLLAALAALSTSLPASAAANGLGFGVAPENSPKGHLLFDAEPGETVRGALLLTNTRREPVSVALRPQDAHSAATGGLDYERPKSGGVGGWLKLADTRIELEAGRSVRVPLTARIPKDARPGDHFAGVVAYNAAELARVQREQPGGRGMQLQFISRFAVAVQFRLPGDASVGMSADEASIETTPSGAAIVIPLHNDGQLLIPNSKGQVTVSRDGQELFTEPVQIAAFIPGGRIRHAIRFRGAPTEGTYHVSGFIHPDGGTAVTIDEDVEFGRKQTKALAAESGQQAIRDSSRWLWLAITSGVLGLIGLVLLALALVKRRPSGARVPVRVPRPVPAAQAVVPPTAAADPGFVATIVDINSADVDQLERLPGIGQAAAARIVGYREEYGTFETLEELAKVPGFDAARVERLGGRATAG